MWPIAETAATGRRVRLLGYCCHQRDMRRRDLRMLRCRYYETKRLSDPPDDAWQTCTGMGCDRDRVHSWRCRLEYELPPLVRGHDDGALVHMGVAEPAPDRGASG